LCYSQTGLTSRYGRLIGCILKEKGLAVDALDMQGFDKSRLTDYDLIIVGTPVFLLRYSLQCRRLADRPAVNNRQAGRGLRIFRAGRRAISITPSATRSAS